MNKLCLLLTGLISSVSLAGHFTFKSVSEDVVSITLGGNPAESILELFRDSEKVVIDDITYLLGKDVFCTFEATAKCEWWMTASGVAIAPKLDRIDHSITLETLPIAAPTYADRDSVIQAISGEPGEMLYNYLAKTIAPDDLGNGHDIIYAPDLWCYRNRTSYSCGVGFATGGEIRSTEPHLAGVGNGG